MSFSPWAKQSPVKNYFPVPNEVYHLGLKAGEIAIYGYLLSIENRETFQCWPSYNTIGKAVRLSRNTVKKYVASLEEKHLITTEPTSVITKKGLKKNGNLRYTIRHIQEAVDHYYERQMTKLEETTERQRVVEQLRKQGRVPPLEPLCGALPETAETDTTQGCESGFGPVFGS